MTRRDVLAPGMFAVPDGAGRIRIGRSPGLVVPDTRAIRAVLAAARNGERVTDTREMRRARALLAPVLRDGDLLGRPDQDGAGLAVTVLRTPDSAPARIAAREGAGISVRGQLGGGPAVEPLLAAAGLRRVALAHATAVLVLSCGEPDREALARLAARPLLVLRTREGTLDLGPFTDGPGTACLRCTDLQAEEDHPGRLALLAALERARRRDGVAEPVDTALTLIALGHAIADLVRVVEGDPPLTRDTTFEFCPGDVAPRVRRWLPHPDCDCRWGRADPYDTMEA